MSSNEILGVALVAAGASDALGAFVIRARLPPERARAVIGALAVTAAALVAGGVVLLVRH